VVGILSRIFGPSEPAQYHERQQAVIVHFTYGSTNFQYIYALEDQLRDAISRAKAGEYDSRKVADDGSDGYFYMYGPDAEALYRAISPVLTSTVFTRSATVTLRFGPAKRSTPTRVIQRSN
jgi:hypothetical protein